MRAEIIAVGSELLTPYRLDTNSLFLTSQLNQLGIRVIHKAVVGDAPDEMRTSFRHALDRADLIVASGGLGPTDDDRTRQTVAELLGRKLHTDPPSCSTSRSAFAASSRARDAGNQRPAGDGAGRRDRPAESHAAPRPGCGSRPTATSWFCSRACPRSCKQSLRPR